MPQAGDTGPGRDDGGGVCLDDHRAAVRQAPRAMDAVAAALTDALEHSIAWQGDHMHEDSSRSSGGAPLRRVLHVRMVPRRGERPRCSRCGTTARWRSRAGPTLKQPHQVDHLHLARVHAEQCHLFTCTSASCRDDAYYDARLDEQLEKLPQAILAKAFAGELVPTEAELARAEGRSYETAAELLERVRREAGTKTAATGRAPGKGKRRGG